MSDCFVFCSTQGNLQSLLHRTAGILINGSEYVSSSAQPPRLAILGLGKMGSILLQAFISQNVVKPKNIVATVNHSERVDALALKYGVQITTDNRTAIKSAADAGRSRAGDRARFARRSAYHLHRGLCTDFVHRTADSGEGPGGSCDA